MADTGNVSAIVKDGKIQPSTASSLSLSKTVDAKNGNGLDKDAFLQLLVAQMKYQDPLEPTDNTEYISQLATFSQLEEMQNMTASANLQRASILVGQEVICKVTNAQTGSTEYVQGSVDYVVYENSKAYVSIDESLYSIDDVYEVINPEYSAAYSLARDFVSTISKLPPMDELTGEYEVVIAGLRTAYDKMSDYEKTFVASDVIKILENYEAKMREIKLGESENAKTE